MAQTEEFMFQNVAYRATVYKTGQLPASWLKTDCQYYLWMAFTHTIILFQEHCESSTSETFDWILPDYCITKDWQLPDYFFLAIMGDNHRTYEIL
jgi:hypothetical protein